MAFALTVLGCSGSYAGPGNACSGYLLRSSGTTLWVDCGPGTLANAQQHVDLSSIDGLVLTHSHPDHWLELPVLRNALKYYVGREHVPAFGTAEILEFASAITSDGLAPTFDWTTISDGSTMTIGNIGVACSRTDHPVETLAMCFESEGRSLAYSADTGPGWSLEAMAAAGNRQQIGLFCCEATLANAEAGVARHLTATQAAEMAGKAGVQRLLLTHLPPGTPSEDRLREAASAFPSVQVASVGSTYEV